MKNQKRTRKNANNYLGKGKGLLAAIITCMSFSLGSAVAKADATAPCNAGVNAGSTECGVNSTTADVDATAVGESAESLSDGSTSLGQDAEIDNMSADAVALGHDAKILNAPGGIAIGADQNSDDIGATATSAGAIAIGVDSVATGANSTVMGASANASMQNATALGSFSAALGDATTAVGIGATSSGQDSTAVGSNSGSDANFTVAIGGISRARSEGSIALGFAAGLNALLAPTDSPNAISIGYFSNIKETSPGAIAIGSSSGTNADPNTFGAQSDGAGAIALGSDADDVDVLGAQSLADNAIAIGADAVANTTGSIVIGAGSTASGASSLALGESVVASESSSLAVGNFSNVSGAQSSALGANARGDSQGVTNLGFGSGFNQGVSVMDSPGSISIGYFANIKPASPGAIAIGGSDGPVIFTTIGAEAQGENAIAIGFEAQATQPGAIALGADVVADKANTMTVGVPIEIVRDDGSSNILVEETNATVAVRTLGELANNGGVRLRFNNMALGEEWDFTSNQSGGFQFSLVGSGGAELSVGTNGTVRMGPGPISNLTLFPTGNMVIEGTLTENSDVNSKQDIKPLNPQTILEKVANLPIQEWEYIDSPDQRHIGPMAQDFYETFQLGNDNTHIATLDMAGVALASIQALQTENDNKDQQIAKLETRLSELESKLAMLIE